MIPSKIFDTFGSTIRDSVGLSFGFPYLFETEAVAQRCSIKKVFLEILQNSRRKTPVPESPF